MKYLNHRQPKGRKRKTNNLSTHQTLLQKAKNQKKTQKIILKWLDKDKTTEYSWFDDMVKAQPPLEENQLPLDGRTVEYAQLLQRDYGLKELSKKELQRVKNDAFNLLKDRSANSIELEYHLENIAHAMSNNIDWINPESNIDYYSKKQGPYYKDWTKPLPLVGKPKEERIPLRYFFNTDLEFQQHGSKVVTKYTTSLTFSIPAARYLNNAIEEEASDLFVDEVVEYHRNVLYGIHHWLDNRAQYYRSSRLSQTMGNVMSDLKIVSIQYISTITHFGYSFLNKIILKRLDEKEYVISEADFPRLHLNDIEDMYLFKVQGKL